MIRIKLRLKTTKRLRTPHCAHKWQLQDYKYRGMLQTSSIMLMIKLLVILDKVKLLQQNPLSLLNSKSMFHCSQFSFVRGIACHFFFEKLHSLV